MKKRICIVTGTRAEYGLFYPLLKKIKSRRNLKLQIVVTGMHLATEFGLTYKEIEEDGFSIDEKAEMLLSSDSEAGITKSVGLGMIELADIFSRLKPDMVVLLGDRFETFAAAVAAFIARIPIAHLHGGELTYGAIDDAFRHSITKMSHLHMVSAEPYRRRVMQLGEDPRRVFTVGALGIDNIRGTKLLGRSELEHEVKFKFMPANILVTFHPVTLENNTAGLQFREILKALEHFKNLGIVFTKPNADTNGRIIIKLIDEYVKGNPDRTAAFVSMGRLRYLSALKHVDAVVGNSSSAIIEAPSFGKPVVNIGDRQSGRIKAINIIDCVPKESFIVSAITKALSNRFRQICKTAKNPYGDGKASERIVGIIGKEIKNIENTKKDFYDLQEKAR